MSVSQGILFPPPVMGLIHVGMAAKSEMTDIGSGLDNMEQ